MTKYNTHVTQLKTAALGWSELAIMSYLATQESSKEEIKQFGFWLLAYIYIEYMHTMASIRIFKYSSQSIIEKTAQ